MTTKIQVNLRDLSCAYASHDCRKESSSAARRRVSVQGCLGMAERRKGTMSFWEGETCEYCDGLLMGRRVTLHRKIKGTYVLIENVSRGVCAQCGTRYYAANVLKTIEESVRGRRKAGREILVPVYSL
jgi:YgiT-type zinc finger domain-containing protein